MMISYSHRLSSSVSRLWSLPRSRSPYDHVPYTGSLLLNAAGIVGAEFNLQSNTSRHDIPSGEVPVGHRGRFNREGVARNKSLAGFRRNQETDQSRKVFKSTQSFSGELANRSPQFAPYENRGGSQTRFSETLRCTSAEYQLLRRAPTVEKVGDANVLQDVKRLWTVGSLPIVPVRSFVRILQEKPARESSRKDGTAEQTTVPFLNRDSRHRLQLRDLQVSRGFGGRLAIPSLLENPRRPMAAIVSSKPQNDPSVTNHEVPWPNAGLRTELHSSRGDEHRSFVIPKREKSFRDRLQCIASVMEPTTPIATWVAASPGLGRPQNWLPLDFPAEVSKPVKPVRATSQSPEHSRPESQGIGPWPESVPGSRLDDSIPSDYEKKRAARLNARPKRMLPRIR
mgnify:FL=1